MGLRQYVEKLIDYDLAQVYQYMEQVDKNKKIISEADPSQQSEEDGPLKGDKTTGTEKVLKSNKLPMVLSAAGALAGGLGWMFQSEWFQNMFKTEELTEKFVDKVLMINPLRYGEIVNVLGALWKAKGI